MGGPLLAARHPLPQHVWCWCPRASSRPGPQHPAPDLPGSSGSGWPVPTGRGPSPGEGALDTGGIVLKPLPLHPPLPPPPHPAPFAFCSLDKWPQRNPHARGVGEQWTSLPFQLKERCKDKQNAGKTEPPEPDCLNRSWCSYLQGTRFLWACFLTCKMGIILIPT